MRTLTIMALSWWFTAATGPNPGQLGPVQKFGPYVNSNVCYQALAAMARKGSCDYTTGLSYNVLTGQSEATAGRPTVCAPEMQVSWPTGYSCWKDNN